MPCDQCSVYQHLLNYDECPACLGALEAPPLPPRTALSLAIDLAEQLHRALDAHELSYQHLSAWCFLSQELITTLREKTP